MERLIQYLDDLEDLIYVAPLVAEQVRRAVQRILFLLAAVGLQVVGVILALNQPPLALAIVMLLLVGMLHRAAVIPIPQTLAVS